MPRLRTVRFLVVLLMLALAAGACSQRDDNKAASGGDTTDGDGTTEPVAETPAGIDTENCTTDPSAEIEGDTINFVSSFPQSGLTAGFSRIANGWKSYFQYVNDQEGGVEINGKKYKIEYDDKDDEYNAQKTSANIEELVGSDGTDAFGVFSVVGTANNINIRDFLGENCVPNIFASTGSPSWGNPEYPWTIGSSLAAYTLEGEAFAGYLKKEKPDATVAMLVQNDDFGAAYQDGFTEAIADTDIKVVKTEQYATGANEVGAQMTSLAATDADAFFNGATLLACPDAFKKAQAANWKPITWVSGTCISKTLIGGAGDAAEGALSMTNVKDPANPAFADDEDMVLFKEQVKKYVPDEDLDNGTVAYGWTQGALAVEAMKTATTASRLGIMDAVRNMKGIEAGLLLDGVSATTGPGDLFMGETVQIIQYDAAKAYFNDVGEPLDFEGKTAELTPPELISA